MRSVRHRISSSRGSGARKGLALDEFEPCEETFMHGSLEGVGGLTACAYPA
jgi:hypothetical protein